MAAGDQNPKGKTRSTMIPSNRLVVRFLLLPLIHLLLVGVVVEGNSSDNCPYDIIIEGRVIQGDGTECFEAPTSNGVLAEVAGVEVDPIVVWDPDATPCHPGSYIHYAADGTVETFQPMTAGAGDAVHTYYSAIFLDGLPLPEGTTGCVDNQDWAMTATKMCTKSWKIARYRSSCPLPSRRPKKTASWFVIFGLLALLFWKRQAVCQWIASSLGGSNTKLASYIALSTFDAN